MQRLELDHGIFQRADQEQRALLVLEEQILGVRAGNAPAQSLGLFDREQRGVRDGSMRNAEPVEEGKQVVGGGGHTAS
jgi:hypothetical protein